MGEIILMVLPDVSTNEVSGSILENLATVRFKGSGGENPLAYRCYDADREVLGRRLEEHLRFAVAYWHSLAMNGSDPFGTPTDRKVMDESSRYCDCLRFSEEIWLGKGSKLNLEANHALLAGHSFQHEIAIAAYSGLSRSIEAILFSVGTQISFQMICKLQL